MIWHFLGSENVLASFKIWAIFTQTSGHPGAKVSGAETFNGACDFAILRRNFACVNAALNVNSFLVLMKKITCFCHFNKIGEKYSISQEPIVTKPLQS